MGWLSSGGTAFSYRMSMPVANPTTTSDLKIVAPFPAWFLYDQGKIAQADYDDVHVTSSDGTTELPCALNANKNQITIDYDSMANGITTLYVYYGHASVSAPSGVSNTSEVVEVIAPNGEVTSEEDTAPVFYFWGDDLDATHINSGATSTYYGEETSHLAGKTQSGWNTDGTKVDNGFEGKTDDADLDTGIWSTSAAGDPASAKYNNDNNNTELGSSMEAKIVGPTGAAYGGKIENVTNGLSTDGDEIRFWLYFDNTTTDRRVYGMRSGSPGWPGSTFYIHFSSSAQITVYTTIAGNPNGYTSSAETYVGAYTTGWQQFRIILDYTNDQYTLGRRTSMGSSFTQLKRTGAGNDNIPMTASCTSHLGCGFEAYQNVNLTIDALQYKTSAITESYTASSSTYHYLVKHFEGAVPCGTVSSAKLWVYAASNTGIAQSTTFKCHRFLNTGSGTEDGSGQQTYVLTGWTNQTNYNYPTWTNRFYDSRTSSVVGWLTAGATNASEIDTSDGSAPTLVLEPSFTVGYKSFTLPTTWVTDWMGDDYSQGMLIKESLEGAGLDRYVTFTAPTEVNSPVLEISFSALDANQFASRKMTTDTHTYDATFPTQNRYIQNPTKYEFAVMAWVNADKYVSLAYISPDGRIHRFAKNVIPSAALRSAFPVNGIFYDPDEHRFWITAYNTSNAMIAAYSDPYVPLNWTWDASSTGMQRADSMPKNGVLHVVYGNDSNTGLYYLTYTRSTDTWSSATTLVTVAESGSIRGIATDHAIGSGDTMDGSGEIYLDGALTYYPTQDFVKIDSEVFFYTGKDDGANKLTGVTRGVWGTTAADHAVGNLATLERYFFAYIAISHDAVRSCFHIIYSIVWSHDAGTHATYTNVCYMRHYYADAAGTWKDEADSTLSLPLNQSTEHVLYTSGNIKYGNGMHVLYDGSVVVASTLSLDVTVNPIRFGTSHVDLLPYGETTWTDIDPSATMREMSIVDMGAGKVIISGIQSTDPAPAPPLMIKTMQSLDGGETWATPATSSTHSFTKYGLWSSSITETTDINDIAYIYALHYAWHGAVIIDGVEITPGGSIPIFMHHYRQQGVS